MSVFVESAGAYRVPEIADFVRRALLELELDLDGRRSALLKPNLVIAAKPSTAIVTHPAVTEAVVLVLREHGIDRITIADGPGVGLDVPEVFRVTGYDALAERLGVELVSFNDAERRDREWKYGTIGVPVVLEDADLYVNLPKMKTHGYTRVTLSVKNHKGMLSEAAKKQDHQLGLHDPLAQHAGIVPPHLIIVDGIVGLEGDGPLNGRPKRSRMLAAGTNMLEVDAACARLMGFDPEKIRHLTFAADEGLGSLSPTVIGDATPVAFEPANEQYGRVMNIYSWRDCTACSMCIDSFSAAVKLAVHEPKYWFTLVPKLLYWGFFGKLHIIQGRKASIPPERGRVVCLGRCTKGLAEKEALVHIPGCPPSARDVAETLRKEL
ncbi:MAG: DUF362 domain-containing protein [Candidatus Eisenbacteria bacterium]|nr:DUF362 domain-containing protein [Candidatus Eisenbacteria bacterium]